MKDHVKKCVARCCELANKRVDQMYKVSDPCLGDHQFKKEELETVGVFSKVCSQIVLKCLYVAGIVWFEIRWFVNCVAQIDTLWTRACDQRLAPVISHIHHTSDNRHYCHVGNTAQDCSKTQMLMETLKILNTVRTEFWVSSEVEHFSYY